MYRRRHNPFRSGPRRPKKPPVMQSTGVQKGRTRCHGCQGWIEAGQPFTRLRLQKRYRVACSSCGAEPKGARRFHPQCVPADVNKAMHFDPNAAQHAHAAPRSNGGAVPPPPKPKTHEELALEALASLEAALIARVQRKGVTPELEKEFKTFQGIKARVLRPGTPGEGEAATSIALQRLIKMVFA